MMNLTKEKAKEILDTMDWTEIKGDKLLIVNTFGGKIFEFEDYELESAITCWMKYFLNQEK